MTKSSDKTEMRRMPVPPKLAAEWLENKNHRNRPLYPATVDDYANTMTQGEWLRTVEPIAFCDAYIDDRGKEWGETLIEGQHRLAAAVKSGVTCEFTVWFHCDPEEFGVMGQGRRRTNRDILQIVRGDSLPHATICATVAASMIRRGLSHNLAVDSWMIRRLLDEMEPEIVRVAEYKRALKAHADGPVLAALALAELIDPDQTGQIVNQMRHGLGMKGERDPCRLLRVYFIDRRLQAARESPDAHFYRVCNALALRLSGGTAARLKLDTWGLQWLREQGRKRLDPIARKLFGRVSPTLYAPVLSERLKQLAKAES